MADKIADLLIVLVFIIWLLLFDYQGEIKSTEYIKSSIFNIHSTHTTSRGHSWSHSSPSSAGDL